MNKTRFEQTLPFFNISKIDFELLTTPMTLDDFVHQYCPKKNVFFYKKGILLWNQKCLTKSFFSIVTL